MYRSAIFIPQGKPAIDVMKDALDTISEMTAHILTTFDASMAKYRATHAASEKMES